MKTTTLAGRAKQVVTAAPGRPVTLNMVNPAIRKLESILVPIDFSPSCRHALTYAVAFARQFDARLCLLSVVDANPTTFDYGNPDYDSWIESRRHDREDQLKAIALAEVPKDLSMFCVTRVGRAFEAIVDLAREEEIDLIIMGTHTERRDSTLIGSTTERVVRHAGCPVLVVRCPEHDFVSLADKNTALMN